MTDTEIEKLALSKDYCSPHGNANVETSAFIAGYKARDLVEQWISVEDRLPESMEDVLCFTRLGKRMVQNCYCTAADQDENWFKEKYSHWQPLPSPPKK